MYQRVLPRDLFNEAKLLKCLGQLCLLIHDEKLPQLFFEFEFDGEDPMQPDAGFIIDQNPDDGSFFCRNVRFYLRHVMELRFSSSLNSRAPYPLVLETQQYGPMDVFDCDGQPTAAFLDFLGARDPDGQD